MLPPPELTPERLYASATRGFTEADEQAGRTPEEVRDFRTRLAALCASLKHEAKLNHLGRAIAWGLLHRLVRNRFALGRYWRRHPQVLGTEPAPPIIIIGQMRGGTTRLHRLLAADPAHSATRFCDAWHPVPGGPVPRSLAGSFDLFWAHRLDPWLKVLHPMASLEVEEELGWLAHALGGSTFYSQWNVPTYLDLCERRDPAPLYAEFARIFRTDASYRGNAACPRVLKVPEFTEALPALLALFPEARLVVASRDRGAVLDSTVSLVANQMAVQSDDVDPEQIRTVWKRKIARREQRVAADLASHGAAVSRIDFLDMERDWRLAIAKIYDELGLSLTRQAEQAMERVMSRSDAGLHRQHQKHLAWFQNGQTEEEARPSPKAQTGS
jgi:hypothetical protein